MKENFVFHYNITHRVDGFKKMLPQVFFFKAILKYL